MRSLYKGVVVVSILGALAMPASAAPRDGGVRDIVKIVKRFIVRTFGDGLTDPKPKTAPGTVTTTGDLLSDPKP